MLSPRPLATLLTVATSAVLVTSAAPAQAALPSAQQAAAASEPLTITKDLQLSAGQQANLRYRDDAGVDRAARQLRSSYRPPAHQMTSRSKVQKFVNAAYSYAGTPYLFGGKSERTMDCSGLIMLAYKKAFGVRIPEGTSGQVSSSYMVPRHSGYISNSQISRYAAFGDLVYMWGWDKSGGEHRHVGVYLGNGYIYSASGPAGQVTTLPASFHYNYQGYSKYKVVYLR